MLVSFDEPPNAVKVRFVSRAWMLTRALLRVFMPVSVGKPRSFFVFTAAAEWCRATTLSARSVARRLCSHAL